MAGRRKPPDDLSSTDSRSRGDRIPDLCTATHGRAASDRRVHRPGTSQMDALAARVRKAIGRLKELRSCDSRYCVSCMHEADGRTSSARRRNSSSWRSRACCERLASTLRRCTRSAVRCSRAATVSHQASTSTNSPGSLASSTRTVSSPSYGAEDLIPTEAYGEADAATALGWAETVVAVATAVIVRQP